MANTFENTDLVTKIAVVEFKNAMQISAKVDRQFDKEFQTVGNTINIRRPVMFSANDGATFSAEDIQEATVSLALDQHKHVDFVIPAVDMKLEVAEATERYIKPAMIELAQQVETFLAGKYTDIGNFSGTPGTTPASFLAIANAKVVLDNLGLPIGQMVNGFMDASASVALADALKGVFPTEIAKKAIERARIRTMGDVDLFQSNSLAMHTVGAHGGTPVVNGASQNVTYATATSSNGWSQSLVTDGWTASTAVLKAGDVITIDSVNGANRRTRASTGNLQTYTVLSDVTSDGSGNATLTISPPIITSGSYTTADAAPADNATITVKTGTASSSYRQNLIMHPNALTLAMAPLDGPAAGADSSMQNHDGIFISAVKQFDIDNYQTKFRFDILFGARMVNPDMAVRLTG